MKFDRNTVIGFLIMGVHLFGYIYYNSLEQAANRKNVAREQFVKDSIDKATAQLDTLRQKADTTRKDTVKQIVRPGGFKAALSGSEQLTIVENDVFKIAFTNKGGQPKWIELKGYKNPDSAAVRLASTSFDRISYRINSGDPSSAGTVETADLYFQPATQTKNTDGSTIITFNLASADSNAASSISHIYTVKKDEYLVDFSVQMNGANTLLSGGDMNLTWRYSAAQQEPDISFEKQNTQIGYVTDGEFDYHTIGRRSDKEFDESVKWLGVRQRFFFSSIVAKNNFSSGSMEWEVPADNEKTLVRSTATLKVPVPQASSAKTDFSLYYGPSDYHLLKKYDLKFEKLVNLGQGLYAFVRPINRFVIMPIFDFMKSFVASYGLAIALLTLFIRLIISPLTYSSYLSGAKMKALEPEIAVLKEKYGKDQQQMSMEQMKLFREAGVNPLGGCIPALLQIPIFFALYSFFNAEVGLRGADFLWAKDLSAFDDVIKFGFHIPLLGSHLSLFTITAVVTSFLISIYSMSMTPDQNNPVMKYLPYIFPVFLLFIFNSLPSALTWYYTVSNLITLALQFVIQNYIIDHNKVLAKIEANRKKPKTKSKWQERMEQMQEQQKKMREMQQKKK